MNDAKRNPSRNPKTFTDTSDGKEMVAYNINVIFQQKILSNRTLPVVVLMMEPRIDDRIATVGGDYHTLATTAMVEVIAETARVSAWVNWYSRHGSRTGRYCSTPGDTGMDVTSKPAPSQVLIGSPTISPSCGIIESLQVGNKQQSTSLDEVRNTQKLDTSVDIKLPDDRDYAYIPSKVIGSDPPHDSSDNLYLRCWKNFSSNVVQTEAP